MVEALASCGIPQQKICDVIGIKAEATLRKHYGTILKTAEPKANAMVAQSLFKKATGNGASSVAAAIFWLKTRAGWSEKNRVELTGADGGAIEVESTEAKRDAIALKLARIAAAGALIHGKQNEDPQEGGAPVAP